MRRILIVEDEPIVRSPIAALLEREGYEVECAASAQEALEAIRRRVPHLVLLDVHLGNGDSGIRVCETLRATPRLERVPIMMLTADTTRETVMRCIAAGANDYLLKAEFQVEGLMARVLKWLGPAAGPSEGTEDERA